MTFAVIVQARMGSSRLPGKVLQPIAGASALAWCLERCAAISNVDAVVCAIPEGAADDPVADEARRVGAMVVRGSGPDVLARYAKAAREVGAQTVMRVTSDCPFIDPEVAGAVRDLLADAGADYACNNLPPLWPHGLDCDVFPAALLLEADAKAREPYEREHVTPWLRAHPKLKKACLTGPGQGFERMRWTLDYAEDLLFFRAVAEALGHGDRTAGWREIASVCRADPRLLAINARRIDEARLTQSGACDVATPPWTAEAA